MHRIPPVPVVRVCPGYKEKTFKVP
jgi:hypothetical protein